MMKNNTVTIVHDLVEGRVTSFINGKEVKTYVDYEVIDSFGMDTIMKDVKDYASRNKIAIGAETEIAFVNR